MAVALASLAIFVHLGVWDHSLLEFDDNIDLNPTLEGLRAGLSGTGLQWALTSTLHANWMPLTRLSWLLDVSLFGFGPRPFLLGNVFYHAAATLLLFAALRKMTGTTARSGFVAGLFALHPLHVESVAWAVERKDVLCGVFWMATLLAYARWVRQPSAARYALVACSMALALLAKSMAVTLPFVLLLLDVWPLGRVRMDGARIALRTFGRVLPEKLPLLGLSAISALVTMHVQKAGDAVRDLALFPPSARLANAALAPWVYLRKFVWPTDLAVFYPHPGETVSYPAAAVAALGLALVSVASLLTVRRRPYLTVGWLWFIGTLVPVIGIVQVGFQALADRYMYVPLVGVSIAVSWGGAELLDRARARTSLRALIAGVLLAGFGIGTVLQVRHWKDSETLFRHALAVTKDNWLAHQSLGGYALVRDDLEAARDHYRESLRIEPGNPAVNVSYGSMLLFQGNREKGIEHLRIGARIARERFSDSPQARVLAETAEALIRDATVVAIERSRAPEFEVELTVRELQEAVRQWPEMPGVQGTLGLALLREGRRNEAEAALRLAVTQEPTVATWHASHGNVLQTLGKTDEAAASYRSALGLQSPWPEVENNLALILATHPDPARRRPAEAIALAESAVAELGRSDAGSLDTLAAAYAAAGDEARALDAANEALRLAEASQDGDAVAAVRTRLEALRRPGGEAPPP